MSESQTERRGTDETFAQLMQLSGSSLLRLAGISKKVAQSYQFRATVLKHKRMAPDIEAIPVLESPHGRIFIEFQGYHDPLIRCRMGAEVLHTCAYLPDEKPIKGIIIYTDEAYKKAALPVKKRASDIVCRFREIVLTDYSEAQLIEIDPRLVVLAPFTLAKKTDTGTLKDKAKQWHDKVCEIYPLPEQYEALAVVGLFIFDRFRELNRTEVIKMLNLDWDNNPMVQELRQEGLQQGLEQGLQQGLKQGLQEGLREGGRRVARKMLLEVLTERFVNVPDSVVKQIDAIESTNTLSTLLKKAMHCNDMIAFQSLLNHHDA